MDVPAARRVFAVALTGLTLVVAGCATPPPKSDPAAYAAYKQANDPLEPLNRDMLKVNLTLDDAILKPVAYIYKETLPQFAQDSVDSFLHNLRTPVILANDLMQGSTDRAWITLVRFVTNSTVGVGGLIDVASDWGYPSHDEDFGQTLAVWGVGSGPYLMLPLFGPSNPRDAVGRAVDSVIDPISWLAPNSWQLGQFAASAVNDRAKNYDAIEDLKKTSLDFYAAVRSLYRQRRADEIRNGKPTANPSGTPSPLSSEPTKPTEQKAEDGAPKTSMLSPDLSPALSPALDDMPTPDSSATKAEATPAAKPAPVAETKPAAKPAPAPVAAAAPVAKPAAVAETAPAPKPAPIAEAKPLAKPMPAPVAEAKPVTKAKTVAKAATAKKKDAKSTAGTSTTTTDEAARAASEAAMKVAAKADSSVPPAPATKVATTSTAESPAEAPQAVPTATAVDFYAAARELAAH